MIAGFYGAHRFLSNFWPAQVVLDGVTYPTVEHAYQAAKTVDPAAREAIRRLDTPGHAKAAGKRLRCHQGWDAVKLNVMEDLLRQKFSADPLRRMLLDTDDAELIEANAWHDYYWGSCDGRGKNHLGRLLMKIREELR